MAVIVLCTWPALAVLRKLPVFSFTPSRRHQRGFSLLSLSLVLGFALSRRCLVTPSWVDTCKPEMLWRSVSEHPLEARNRVRMTARMRRTTTGSGCVRWIVTRLPRQITLPRLLCVSPMVRGLYSHNSPGVGLPMRAQLPGARRIFRPTHPDLHPGGCRDNRRRNVHHSPNSTARAVASRTVGNPDLLGDPHRRRGPIRGQRRGCSGVRTWRCLRSAHPTDSRMHHGGGGSDDKAVV